MTIVANLGIWPRYHPQALRNVTQLTHPLQLMFHTLPLHLTLNLQVQKQTNLCQGQALHLESRTTILSPLGQMVWFVLTQMSPYRPQLRESHSQSKKMNSHCAAQTVTRPAPNPWCQRCVPM